MLISVMIGNSDNKLTQQEWASFVDDVNRLLASWESARHFFGGAETYAKWQNVCWVCELGSPDSVDALLSVLSGVRRKYKQDSACVLLGEAKFV